jgi:hypothetical protein
MTVSEATTPWALIVGPTDPLPGRAALAALRAGTLGLVVFRDRMPGPALASCQAALVAQRLAAGENRYPNATLTTFGPYLARHLGDPSPYFQRAHEADVLFPDPRTDLRMAARDLLRRGFELRSIQVPAEPDGRRYAAGVVRLNADGVSTPIHNDHIARDAAGTGLLLAGLRSQFSCVVCIQECTCGGELLLYRRQWQPSDERFKRSGWLGYDARVVADAPLLAFKPRTGDVYVMNPVNYHGIAAVRGAERQTLGFFFGHLTDDLADAVAWS